MGLAFKVNDKTVVRAGGAIFYAPLGGGGFNIVTAAMGGLAETPFIASLNNGISPTPEPTSAIHSRRALCSPSNTSAR